MSSSWLDSYLGALKARDRREKSNASIYEAYTKLADHAAALAARSAQLAAIEADAETLAKAPRVQTAPPGSIIAPLHAKTTTKHPPKIPHPIVGSTVSAPDDLASLRADLYIAQKSKTALAAQLATVEAKHAALRTTHGSTTAALSVATSDKAVLERKLKDRDSELRAKRELLERVQDEIVGLEMQVNVAEEEKKRLKEENQALVKRLVGEREVEVERVNRESGWG